MRLGLLLLFSGALGISTRPEKLAEEPSYTSPPQYVALKFGGAAPRWLVIDGVNAYLDRNLDNRITPDELVEGVLDLDPPPQVKQEVTFEFAAIGGFDRLSVEVTTRDPALDRPGDPDPAATRVIAFAHRGKTYEHVQTISSVTSELAPVAWFSGPRTLGLVEPTVPTALVADDAVEVRVSMGTPGNGRFAFVRHPYDQWIPSHARPEARVTFRPQSPDVESVRKSVRFRGRC
ncbi:MAG: hypothetical protein KDC38_20875 [Planctomycetes bacterium]|nr:hypothetical protein [Planctomycetota bacterium]